MLDIFTLVLLLFSFLQLRVSRIIEFPTEKVFNTWEKKPLPERVENYLKSSCGFPMINVESANFLGGINSRIFNFRVLARETRQRERILPESGIDGAAVNQPNW